MVQSPKEKTSSGSDPKSSSKLSYKLLVLSTLSRYLGQGVDFEEFLGEAADKIAFAMDATRVTIYFVDKKRGELWSKVAHLEEISEIRLKLGQGVAGHVAVSGGIMNIPTSYSEEHFYSGIDQRTGFKTISQLCAPIRDQAGEILGVVQVLNKKNGCFVLEDEQFLEVLSTQLATLLESTSFYQQIKSPRQLTTRTFPLKSRYNNIIGASSSMQKVFRSIAKIAPVSITALIRGESGTGKEMVARAIHLNSPRKDRPFVKIDCTTLPDTLLENELFGHEKGAFTGAALKVSGKIGAAGDGTLFIDEIGDLPPSMQGKLLRVLQDRQYEPLGSTHTLKVESRILAATNRNLETLVAEKKFRNDLYFRIKVAQIELPPLRLRGNSDIISLAEHFLDLFNRKHQRNIRGFTTKALEIMSDYPWPGNVRELQNCVESAVVFAENDHITHADLALPKKVLRSNSESDLLSLREVEKNHILRVLDLVGNNRSKAAEILQIGRNTLQRKIKEYGL